MIGITLDHFNHNVIMPSVEIVHACEILKSEGLNKKREGIIPPALTELLELTYTRAAYRAVNPNLALSTMASFRYTHTAIQQGMITNNRRL